MPASKTRKPKDDKKFKQHVNQREAELLSVKPAVRIQKLKNMFIILAHELYANKHKNQATYRKTQSFTYNKTREETLNIEYKQLKLVSDNLNFKIRCRA